jgi:hypothetical protein
MADTKEQREIAERLQLKWLQRMEKLIDQGEVTSTDMATLARVLMANGWNLDPAALPTGLADKLSTAIEDMDLGDAPLPGELWGNA